MKPGWWIAFGLLVSAVVAAAIGALYAFPASAGSVDPVSAAIGLLGLAVALATLAVALRDSRDRDLDVRAAAERLAVAVGTAETRARYQLLGGHDRAIDLSFDFQPPPAHYADGTSSSGSLHQVIDYYRRIQPRRLVITGAAGSGKTVTAIELILGLIEAREDRDPVPVRMSMALLNTERPAEDAVSAWVVGHLVQAFGLAHATARALVESGMVLPVLDGLDEMDASGRTALDSRAAAAVRACNAYLHRRHKAALVVTCRSEQYAALGAASEWVRDAAQVALRPVTVVQTRDYLAARTDDLLRWQPVLHGIETEGSPVALALSTPWRLALAVTVYDRRDRNGRYERNPAYLAGSALGSEAAIRDHLLALFIPTVAAIHHAHYPNDRIWRWLSTLAQHLDGNAKGTGPAGRGFGGRAPSGTDIVLDELWPLAGTRLPRAVELLPMAIAVGWLGTQISGGTASTAFERLRAFLMVGFLGYSKWKSIWPNPERVDLKRKFLTVAGRRRSMVWFAVGFASGYLMIHRLLAGVGLGLAGGLASGILTPAETAPTGPRDTLRRLRISALAYVTWGVLAVGLPVGVVKALDLGHPFSIAALASFLLVALVIATACAYYLYSSIGRFIALILCTRRGTLRWLPMRLGRFLDWCVDAGVMRIAGPAYQFRHREIQDFLARHPRPF